MTRTQTPDQTRARKRGPTLATTTLKVIDGGGARIGPRHQAIVPEAPHLCVSELAADMAEIFALSLLRKRGLADLDDPHCAVWIDSATHFTLHELLCDLRSLAWFDQTRSLPEIGRRFGGRDHTTVMHGVRRIEELKTIDGQIAEDVEMLRRALEA